MEEQSFLLTQDVLVAGNVWKWFVGLPIFIHLLLAAAVLALIGAAIYSRASHAARLRMEREFNQRSDDREFFLRRDVYLPAAEAIARAQEFLGKSPATDLNKDGAQLIIDYVIGSLGKVHLVASERTLKSTMAFATDFTTAFLELNAKKQPLLELQNELDSLDTKVQHLSVERDHLLASITRLAGDGLDQHGGIWGDMNMRFDKLHREIATLIGHRSDKISTLARMRREFSVEAAQCSLKLARLGVPAYLALRQELGMPIDELDYRGLAQRNIAEIEKALRGFAGGAARTTEVKVKPVEVMTKPADAKQAQVPASSTSTLAAKDPADPKPHETRLKMVLKRSR